MKTIDITPTWGEFGNIYARFAESGETKSVRVLRADLARAMAAAQALQELELSSEQSQTVARVMVAELEKQGVGRHGDDDVVSYEVRDPFSECTYSYPTMRRAIDKLGDLNGSIFSAVRKDGHVLGVFRREADGSWSRNGKPFDMASHLSAEVPQA